MANQNLDLQIKGLYTSPNNLSGVPQGALEFARNLVIDTKNIASSRRGQTQYGNPLSIGSGQVNKIFNYASSLILNYDDKLAYDSGNGTWVDYSGNYVAPSSLYKMRSLEALRNFYFTTDAGIYKLDSLTSIPRKAGVVRALGGTAQTVGSTGFLLDNSAVAYRMIWGYIDANNNLILGAPSQRLVVANETGNPVDVELTYAIPDSITTEYFYQIYRSTGTATAIDEPSDELQLVIQGNPTSGEIAAKEFTVLDVTPYSLMRTTLYTSPSVEGIENANTEPPFALDMDVFKGCAFYANIKQKQSLSLAMISVDSPSLGYVVEATAGITNGDPTITSIADTSILRVGMRVFSSDFPSGTKILSIDSSTQVTATEDATGSTGTVSIEFQDGFSIGGVEYWAGSTQDTSTNTFLVDNSGTPAQNLNATAINLVQLINTSPSNTTIYAYYISGVEDLPGQILFEERIIGGSAFTATSTAGSSWSPNLPSEQIITAISMADPTQITSLDHGLMSGDRVTIYGSNSTPSVNGTYVVTVIDPDTFSIPIEVTVAGTDGYFVITDNIVESDNDERQNRVAISKPGQVEAVPLYTYFDVGSANFPIQRVVALRDGIFFFKLDGIYRLSGENFSSFVVTLIDNTVTLKAPESAVPFNNQVFCFTTQGVCAVTDSGVQIMSVPIENDLLELSSEQFTYFSSASFGVAYESARQYMFFTVTAETDEFATQAFIYNSLTDTWTQWVMNRTCGVVNKTVNKLFMAETNTGQILIERKSFTNDDYADEQYPVTITSVDSGIQMTLSDATNVEVGMTIQQNTRRTLIVEVDEDNDVIVVDDTSNFETGSADVFTPIDNFIQWAPIDAENPGLLKQFSEITLLFRNAAFDEIAAGFASDISVGTQIVHIEAISGGAWGLFPWGVQPWGGTVGGVNVLRTYVPRESQRGAWLTLNLRTQQAFTGFSLQGVSVIYNVMSSRRR